MVHVLRLGSLQSSHLRATKRLQSLRDHFVQRATDRRRGVVEDLHLAIEIIIETVFRFVHKAAYCLLSPRVEVVKWFFSCMHGPGVVPADGSGVSVPTDTLSESDPMPKDRQTSFYQSLNTDARTCQDVITELGLSFWRLSKLIDVEKCILRYFSVRNID